MTAPTENEPTFERYRVVAKLRSGPVTDLYRAEQKALGRPVVIKALARGILPGSPFASSLEREASLLTELDHPNIIRALDLVREKETLWLVLEHVDGFSLEEILEKKKRLSPPATVAIGLEVARALAHAHERGVVHRDISPRNVLVARDGGVKLVSFASAADARLPTAPELLDGNAGFQPPAYMSPEQLLGEPEDPRSDLFSLGMVLYETLAGKRAFETSDERASSHKIRHDPVAPLTRARPDVSPTLDRLVRRCLEKLPSDRFASASELASALGQEFEGLGRSSTRDTIVEELSRLGLVQAPVQRRDSMRLRAVGRRPATVKQAVVGQLVALALVVGGGGAIRWGSVRARGDAALRGSARLELTPKQTGYLRVVADPWANVFVDGEAVDTTPFARSIPLSAGTHYVRLEHPSAKTERRTVTLAEGETVLIDVKMDVTRPRLTRPEGPVQPNLVDPATP
ncbi:MAG TPA: serine/threonine-protein kinase [Polyangiaceae bacterium]|nr:serine/threonine-protein kinase [Polyangiaceae bacterium]